MKNNGSKLTKERSRRYPAQTISDADYADDIEILANTPTQAKTLLHSLEWAAAGSGLHVNTEKKKYACFKRRHLHTKRLLSETSRQVHQPMKQCLINRDWHQHVTGKGMDSFRLAIGHIEVRADRKNKTQFFPSSGHIDSAWTWLNVWRKTLTATTQECYEQCWTSPRDSTPQSSSCTATYHSSWKLSKLDEPDMRDTAGEVGTNSLAT